MSRIRSILLSGLVALLMVGMVSAGERSTVDPPNEVHGPIRMYMGTWVSGVCVDDSGGECLSIGVDIDIAWLIDLFN